MGCSLPIGRRGYAPENCLNFTSKNGVLWCTMRVLFYVTVIQGVAASVSSVQHCNELEHTGWTYSRSIHRRLHNALITTRYDLNLLHDDLFARKFVVPKVR